MAEIYKFPEKKKHPDETWCGELVALVVVVVAKEDVTRRVLGKEGSHRINIVVAAVGCADDLQG